MRLQHLGPGILLAATSVGASHILMSPEAGARFEYGLIWIVLIAHIFKYQAFECAPRYVAARGESLLEAYAAAPGPKHWALWLGIVDMAIQAVGLIAALVGLTASFLVAVFSNTSWSGGSIPVWSLVLTAVLLALLRWGRYASLRLINLGLMLLLAVGTIVAFLGAPPPMEAIGRMFRPALPEGSLLLVSAILGFMPTSVAVSIWQSLWALEQGRFRADRASTPEKRQEALAAGLFDLRLGYALSTVLAILFVCLGATVLHPRGLVPEGTDVALTLSQLYGLALGEWMRPFFLAMAFAALFTTCYTMMDGFPRSFIAALRALRGQPAQGTAAADSDGKIYWTFLIVVTFGGMAILSQLPDPAWLVKLVGAFGLLLSPVYFLLNLWAVTRRIDDPRMRPNRFAIGLSIAGIVFMVLTAGLLIWTEPFLP